MTNSKLFIPFIWKVLLITLIIILSTLFLSITIYLNIDIYQTFQQNMISMWPLLLAIVLLEICLVSGFMYLDKNRFFSHINGMIFKILKDKKLDSNLDHFYSGKTQKDLSYNIKELFDLMRSFDQIKSSRIKVEIQTLKLIIDNVLESIIIINKDKIVSLINHKAETVFGLIPGEILGQYLFRKITINELKEPLNLAIKNNEKTINLPINIGKKSYKVDIYPVKDRYNEVNRAIIMIQK